MSKRVLMSAVVAAALAVGYVAPASAQEPIRVGGDIKEPRKIKDVKPAYPEDAQRSRTQGIVIIEALINTEGKVENTRLLRGVQGLDEAALDAVQQWQYTPTLLNGQPVPVIMTVTVTFSLAGPTGAAPASAAAGGSADVAAMLDYAKAVHARGLNTETERVLLQALAALQAERARSAVQSAQSAAPGAVRVGPDVIEPKAVKRVEPVYPAGTTPTGVSIVEIVVGTDGRVTDAKVLRSRGNDIDLAVLTAVRQWQFATTMLNGVAVPVVMTITVR